MCKPLQLRSLVGFQQFMHRNLNVLTVLRNLRIFPHQELLMLMPDLLRLLDDSSKDVAKAAAAVVSRLPSADLVQLVPQLLSMLHPDSSQRTQTVLSIIEKLPHSEVMKVSDDLLHLLDPSCSEGVKVAAAIVLSRLPAEDLVKLKPDLMTPLLRLLDSSSKEVAMAASGVISQLPPGELVELVPELFALVQHSDHKSITIQLFCKLPHDELLKMVPKMALLLVDYPEDVQRTAAAVVSQLPSADLVQLVPQLQSMLHHVSAEVVETGLSIVFFRSCHMLKLWTSWEICFICLILAARNTYRQQQQMF